MNQKEKDENCSKKGLKLNKEVIQDQTTTFVKYFYGAIAPLDFQKIESKSPFW